MRPRFLVRDRAVLTGHQQRDPQRFGICITDPVTGAPFEIAVFKYLGPPNARQILAVHGFRGDHHGLELIVDGLAPYEVWVPDLPGFGVSGAMPDAEHTVEHYAHVINQIAQHMQRPILVGHSFGSVVAAAAVAAEAVDYPHLVLLNPIAKPALDAGTPVDRAATLVTDGFYRLCAALPTALGRRLLGNTLIVWATGAFMTKTDDPRVLAYTHDQHQTYFSGFDSPATLLEAYQASITHTVADFADRLGIPVTMIGGADDELSSPEDISALAEVLATDDVETYVLQHTGHLMHYERSGAVAVLMMSRLEEA
ncbi:hypothetical protein GCM10022249_08370 [Enteractinococcus coprophilus]